MLRSLSLLLLIFLCTCAPPPENVAEKTDDGIREPALQSSDKEETSVFDAATYRNALQGSWKRTSYPYGTVEFEGAQVKITPGEGVVEPPEFSSFELVEDCPFTRESEEASENVAFMVINGEGACTEIALYGSRLTLLYSKASGGVEYARVE